MFGRLRKMLYSGNRAFRFTSVNDIYLQSVCNVDRALGGNLSSRFNRSRGDKKTFLLDFKGDIFASASNSFSKEVSAVIWSYSSGDEVLIRLESAGGAVHSYGYVASQISRLRDKNIPVTVSVDRIAASGGYMVACVANRIISAPFAILGSIGVVSEFPNFNRLVSDLGIDYKSYTVGKYKRTVSTWSEISEDGESKFKEDMLNTYNLFKTHISRYRPSLDIENIATGETWYGSDAKEIGLIDEVITSDEWIINKITRGFEVIKVSYMAQKTWSERINSSMIHLFENILTKAITLVLNSRNVI